MSTRVRQRPENEISEPTRTIGLLAERSLHAALKKYLAQPGDDFEVRIEGFWIDLVHYTGKGKRKAISELIEIQTGSFGPLRRKLLTLLPNYAVRVVHPLPIEKQLVWLNADGEIDRQRRSPTRRSVADVCHALTFFPDLLTHPNLTLEVLLTREIELRRPKIKKHRRARGYTSVDRQLVEVVEHHVFECAADLLTLLPSELPPGFTNRDIAHLAHISLPLAQRLSYCLRQHGLLEVTEKRGRAMVQRIAM